jgi:hypothetical protein
MTALGLCLAAWPLWHLSRSSAAAPVVPPATTSPGQSVTVPFSLELSAPARQVILRDENSDTLWQSTAPVDQSIDATLPRLPRNIAIEIIWNAPPAPRFFAKLRLDVPTRESLTHVFDASGDIDDLWELP